MKESRVIPVRSFLGILRLTIGILAASIAAPWAGGESLLDHLRYLASDELKGRGNGSSELEKAALYIAGRFEEYGLAPAGEDDSYFQEFELAIGRRLGPQNSIDFVTESGRLHLQSGRDFRPLSSGAQMTVSGAVVFAGFGISAPELNYDDYRDMDVRGKVVLAFEHEPKEQVEGSVFSGRELSPYATVLHKILNARSRGAVALLLIPDVFNHISNDDEDLSELRRVEVLGIHAAKLSLEWGERLLGQSGRDAEEVYRWLNHHVTPYSFQTDFNAEVSIDVVKVSRTVRNVLGLVPGQTDEVVVIGAHYDHLGLGDKTSLAPELIGEIHNGADDNASGTAGLLQLAQEMGSTIPAKSLLFVAFAGEELGLLGSRHYAEQPTIPLEKTVAMLNLDMIGRSRGDLLVGGVGTASEFRVILDRLQEQSPLQFSYSDNLRGSSDHLSFSAKRVPVLFFFSGLHGDYHRPSDDWQKIDVERTEQILDVVRSTLDGILSLRQQLVYQDVVRRSQSSRSGGRRHGPRFGCYPDTSWELEGVRFSEIVMDSPAAKAGLQGGDVLVGFDGQTIRDLHDFTSELRRREPGDEVGVVVLREGQVVRATVRLDSRR